LSAEATYLLLVCSTGLRGIVMKAFVLACGAAIVIAAIAVVALNAIQEPAQQAFSTSAVRL
jgi:hypothetical protein